MGAVADTTDGERAGSGLTTGAMRLARLDFGGGGWLGGRLSNSEITGWRAAFGWVAGDAAGVAASESFAFFLEAAVPSGFEALGFRGFFSLGGSLLGSAVVGSFFLRGRLTFSGAGAVVFLALGIKGAGRTPSFEIPGA